MRRCVWFRNLKNEEALVRVGPQRHRGWGGMWRLGSWYEILTSLKNEEARSSETSCIPAKPRGVKFQNKSKLRAYHHDDLRSLRHLDAVQAWNLTSVRGKKGRQNVLATVFNFVWHFTELYHSSAEGVVTFQSSLQLCRRYSSTFEQEKVGLFLLPFLCGHWGTEFCCRGQLKCDDTRAETRFLLSAKRTSPF